jgi:hypothetical protein
MRKSVVKRTLKLRLLAFVLAMALVWYSLHPAPASGIQIKREDELPDNKKRKVEPQFQRAAILPSVFGVPGAGLGVTTSPAQDEEDDFDWPEFIDG